MPNAFCESLSFSWMQITFRRKGSNWLFNCCTSSNSISVKSSWIDDNSSAGIIVLRAEILNSSRSSSNTEKYLRNTALRWIRNASRVMSEVTEGLPSRSPPIHVLYLRNVGISGTSP